MSAAVPDTGGAASGAAETPGDEPPSRLAIDVVREGGDWPADAEAVIGRAAEAAYAAAAPAPAPGTARPELAVLLADDAAVRRLNRDFRGKDSATNVLSFPADDDDADGVLPPDAPPRLGDLALAAETLAREAESEGKSVAEHLAHLVVHGVLHLMGMDHEDDDDAVRMESLEIAVLAELGVPDPYAARHGAGT